MRRYKTLPPNRPLPTIDPIPLTASFFQQTKDKYRALQKERTEVMARLKTAREMGDLSENGAYRYAKFELGSIGRQLRDLGFLLKYGFVAEKSSSLKIGFGSVVTLEEKNKSITYTLLSEYEANPSQQSISLKSPLGQLLIGKQVGDTVELVLPKETKVYLIKQIS